MMKAKEGRIINISSVIGEMGNAGQVAYSASKAGLIGLTKSLAKELASRGVTVNAVTPGYIVTDMTDTMTDASKEAVQSQIPLARLGSSEDIASAVSFLASPQASLYHRPDYRRKWRHVYLADLRKPILVKYFRTEYSSAAHLQ